MASAAAAKKWPRPSKCGASPSRGPISSAADDEATCRVLPGLVVPHAPGKRRRGAVRRRYSWAALLQRVFLIDVLRCPCGGVRTVLAAIHDPDSIWRVLEAMGLPSDVPAMGVARGPQEQGEWWGA